MAWPAAKTCSKHKRCLVWKKQTRQRKAGIIEHETKLKAAGFRPEMLRKAPSGEVYIICEIPENEISRIKIGSACEVEFPSYPNENEIFNGNLSDIADVVDNATRMAKFSSRFAIPITGSKRVCLLRCLLDQRGKNLSVNQKRCDHRSGRNYVFIKTGPLTLNAGGFNRQPD